MSSDNQLADALRALAGHGGQGTVPAAADVRRRGDVRRRRRRAASVSLAALAVAALGAGVALAGSGGRPHPVPIGPAGPTSAPVASPWPDRASSGPTGGTSAPPTGSSGPPAGPPGGDPVLSGQRQVTVVRVAASAGGVSLLDGGRLAEVDGDEGRQLFVFVPQGDTYQIRAAEPGPDGADTCWEVRSSGSEPLRVEAAGCARDEPRQRFTVVRDGSAYAISSQSAYLQFSPTWGLILEEAGDAAVTTRFRLVDNGPAPG
ncbi:RICIN domain-containing protein [Micromonospora haikouensis]|uniref:RICIN domain-containing protein n=1 Tax=Micromonospora haikouensis TaxID=686309 RepID=UPI003D8E7028